MYWPLWKRIIRRVKFWLCPHWSRRFDGYGWYACKWCAGKQHFFFHEPWKLYWHPTDTWRKGPRESNRVTTCKQTQKHPKTDQGIT